MSLGSLINKHKPGHGISGVEGVSTARKRPENHPDIQAQKAEDMAARQSAAESALPLSGREIAYGLGAAVAFAGAIAVGASVGNGFQEVPGLHEDKPAVSGDELPGSGAVSEQNQLPGEWGGVVQMPTPAGQNPESAPGSK